MKQIIIGFGILIACLLALFQLAKFSHWQSSNVEVWIAIFSLVFFGIGIFISRKMFRKEVVTEKQIIVEVPVSNAVIDEKQLEKTGLSKREYEILQLINEGMSNQQIADKLFISENTIKKHVSSLFLKLDVQRRTEAIKKAKQIKIIY